MRRWFAGIAAVTALSMLGACAPAPKYIAASTSRPEQIKLLYVQKGGGQGIIKCARGADGALTGCRSVAVVLEGE